MVVTVAPCRSSIFCWHERTVFWLITTIHGPQGPLLSQACFDALRPKSSRRKSISILSGPIVTSCRIPFTVSAIDVCPMALTDGFLRKKLTPKTLAGGCGRGTLRADYELELMPSALIPSAGRPVRESPSTPDVPPEGGTERGPWSSQRPSPASSEPPSLRPGTGPPRSL